MAVLFRFKKFLFSVIIVSIIGAIFIGFWFARTKTGETAAPVLSAPFASEKLSTNGKVFNAVILPDGKNVVYTNGIEGRQSVWLRQFESSNNVEIIPPSDDFYYRLALSPDGNFLYFTRRPKVFDGQANVYRVSIFGGVPNKIISETQGRFSISPDGAKISFVRCYYREDEHCSLWIADAADGKNERKIASRPSPIRIADNEISPDGKSVAFAVGQSQNQANEFSLSEVDIESGVKRELTAQKFFNIKSLAWLPDKSKLLLTASRVSNKHFRIWRIPTKEGEEQLIVDKGKNRFAFSPDGLRIAFLEKQGEANILMIISLADGQRIKTFKLTDERANLIQLKRSPDGKNLAYILAVGEFENKILWFQQLDGKPPRQIANLGDERISLFGFALAPDGKSLAVVQGRWLHDAVLIKGLK